jgi:hypothetical protein
MGNSVPWLVFPRYTVMIGTTALYSEPVDVREFARVLLTGWQGTGLGTVGNEATVEFTVQQSVDLSTWFDGIPFGPASADAEVSQESDLRSAWMRVKAEVTGSDPGVSLWLRGVLVRRETRPGEGRP